jgi:hypothetical protein
MAPPCIPAPPQIVLVTGLLDLAGAAGERADHRGLTNAGIAERLSLAEGTARNHVTSILGSLGVDDRA